jgi:hypothetical protein
MKQLLLIVVMLMFMVVCLSGCTEKNASSESNSIIVIDGKNDDWQSISVFIKDVEGDVRTEELDENFSYVPVYEFDVMNMKFAMDTTYFFILMEFANEITYYNNMNKENAKIIGVIYLDTDTDNSTGG